MYKSSGWNNLCETPEQSRGLENIPMGSEAKRKWLKCQFWVNCSFKLPCHRVTLSGIVVVVELRPQHRAIATLPLKWSGVLQDRGVGEGPGRVGLEGRCGREKHLFHGGKRFRRVGR